MKLEIQGLRRSGTNYLTALLDRNLHDAIELVNGPQRPHEETNPHLPGDRDHDARLVVIAKHPQAWIDSIEQFFVREDPQVLRSAVHTPRFRATLAGKYVNLYANWGCVVPKIIRYEKLLEEPAAELRRGLPNAVLPLDVEGPIEDVEQRVGRHDGEHEELTHDVPDRSYYTEHRWRSVFSPADLRFIRREFDCFDGRTVLRHLGYELEDPQDGMPK